MGSLRVEKSRLLEILVGRGDKKGLRPRRARGTVSGSKSGACRGFWHIYGALRVSVTPGALSLGAIAPPKKHPSPLIQLKILIPFFITASLMIAHLVVRTR